MDNLFDKLYNEVILNDELETEKCNICHYKINKDEQSIILKCNHYYHNSCLKKKKGKCPYCNKYYNIENSNNTGCQFIIKRGLHKGKICGRFICNYHKSKVYSDNTINDNTINTNVCTVILKSGVNKGNQCGRTNCKYHNKNIVI